MTPAGNVITNSGLASYRAIETTYIEPSPPPPTPRQRRYLPSLADLIDRLTIAQQKQIFIHERRQEYASEIADIMHDIDLILNENGHKISAQEIKAICILMLANRYIWENEAKTRNGSSNEEPAMQLYRLKATHSINGIRATAKNILSNLTGQRCDYKIDCYAADLPLEFGHWDIFSDASKE